MDIIILRSDKDNLIMTTIMRIKETIDLISSVDSDKICQHECFTKMHEYCATKLKAVDKYQECSYLMLMRRFMYMQLYHVLSRKLKKVLIKPPTVEMFVDLMIGEVRNYWLSKDHMSVKEELELLWKYSVRYSRLASYVTFQGCCAQERGTKRCPICIANSPHFGIGRVYSPCRHTIVEDEPHMNTDFNNSQGDGLVCSHIYEKQYQSLKIEQNRRNIIRCRAEELRRQTLEDTNDSHS